MIEEKKIVIFEDDQDIHDICRIVLEEMGWNVYIFSDCIDVVSRVTEISPVLVIMDNWIPNDGGVIACQKLKSDPLTKQIPIIYFSANNQVKALAEEAGADAHLTKPFNLEELEKIVEEVYLRN